MAHETSNSDTRCSEGPDRGATPIPDAGVMVLVAEDDTAFRFILAEAFEAEGFSVVSAANGVEALEIYRNNPHRIGVVVSDIFMPGMDGLSAAVEMRKIDGNVFFLFMSGYGAERIKEIGISMEDIPNSTFFEKPFAFKDLINTMRKLRLLNQI
jgi:two-component system, cell cycle sensor histidine kinase and response regulator CckA